MQLTVLCSRTFITSCAVQPVLFLFAQVWQSISVIDTLLLRRVNMRLVHVAGERQAKQNQLSRTCKVVWSSDGLTMLCMLVWVACPQELHKPAGSTPRLCVKHICVLSRSTSSQLLQCSWSDCVLQTSDMCLQTGADVCPFHII